jgi:sugar (pentulose or hexulose) kinase
MTAGPQFLGIDAGLTNLTAAAFDDAGTELASATRPTPTRSPSRGRATVDHDDLWMSTAAAIGDLLADEAVDADAVRGVGLAGHGHGLYALDADADPVCGIPSTDDRATDLLAAWRDDGRLARASEPLGWEPFGADPYSLLGWVAQEAPAVADRIDTVLFCKDVLRHRLTGVAATDPMEGSALRPPDGDVDAVLEALDLEAFGSALPDVTPSTEVAGTVTAEAAAETGLPEGVPVAAGLHDVGACALGAGVVAPGQAAVILGTWGQSVVVTGDSDDGAGGLPRRYLDGWLRYRGTRAGAACLDWFVEEFGDAWRRLARERGVDPYRVYDEAAASVPAGADGLLFHPYLRGSTDDPGARGGFYGLRLDHTAAHLLRAVYEGVALELARGVRAFGVPVTERRLTGGGARSEVWSAVFADVFGAPVAVPAGEETGARGAALCAGVATGRYADVDEAVAETVAVERTHRPDAAAADRYRTLAAGFERARESLGPTWETLMDASGERTDE